VRAGLGVDALVGETEALDGAAGDEMLFDDGGGIFGLDVAIPDRLGVDDDGGTVLALIEAEGFVDAHASGETGVLGELREASVQVALTVGGAGWARGIGGADVMTDEDVAFERGQTKILLFRE
jgi:hypothetical protein